MTNQHTTPTITNTTENNHYLPESAGRLMTRAVPSVSEKATVGHIEELLLKEAKKFETINYIYLVNDSGHLKGVVSLKELFRSSKKTPLKELSPIDPVHVRARSDQEKVARLALKNNIKAVPVVDKENVFLGVVTSDTILNILHTEMTEDILRFGGVMHKNVFDNVFSLPLITSLKHRLPWLMVGLFGGIVVAGIVGSFEAVLSKNLLFAAFIPLVVYMASAVGIQMEAFIIRDLAINPTLRFTRYFARQTIIVLLIAFILSFLLYGSSLVLYGNSQVSIILGLALFFAIFSSLITGLLIPYLFGKLRLDPANASGPVATIIQDALSVLVYFAIASLIL